MIDRLTTLKDRIFQGNGRWKNKIIIDKTQFDNNLYNIKNTNNIIDDVSDLFHYQVWFIQWNN
jgi:hypothetical protein